MKYRHDILRLLGVAIICSCLFFMSSASISLHAETYSPEQVKAAMLIKFTDFITWPEEAFERSQGKFVIGVLDSPKVFRLLSSLSGRTVQGRPLHVVRMDEWRQGPDIHMIYMDSAVLDKWEAQIRSNNRKFILTVSDSDEFLAVGGMLSFVDKDGGRLGFSVNRVVQQHSRLVFSSALLRLATIKTYGQEEGN